MTDNLAIEKLVDDLNMLGKHGVAAMNVIVDGDDLSGAFFKFYGPKDSGAILSGIANLVNIVSEKSEISDKQKEGLLNIFRKKCNIRENDEPDTEAIKSCTSNDVIDTELGKIVLKDIEDQTNELGNMRFHTLSLIHVSDNRTIYYIGGDVYTVLFEIAACIENIFRVLTVDDKTAKQFYYQIQNSLN